MDSEDRKSVMLEYLNNVYVSGGISAVLVLYATIVAPTLPYSSLKVMDNMAVKLVLLGLIIYLAFKKPQIAVLLSLAVMVTILVLRYLSKDQDEQMPMSVSNGDGAINSNVVGDQSEKMPACPACGNGERPCPYKEQCPYSKMMHQVAEYVEVKNNNMQPPTVEDSAQNTEEVIFDEQSLVALREKVQERKQNTQVSGFDSAQEYALV